MSAARAQTRRDSMIAHPDEITEAEICVAQIAEILDERFRHPVIARLEQLTRRQIGKAESPQRRNEIRGHTVVTQLLEIVEGKVSVSRVGKAPMNSRDTPWSQRVTS